ncbi:hypothetical protein HY489_06390 [Candidatus Woesearchaeota archaeon]|nr:hypothetical protein [Candidatus Woesearchaeota archaeon]
MAHITLSIPDEVYREMKKHPEIKWSEVARERIIERTKLLKKSMHVKEFFRLVSPETREAIDKVSEKEWIEFTKKIREKDKKRARYLIHP